MRLNHCTVNKTYIQYRGLVGWLGGGGGGGGPLQIPQTSLFSLSISIKVHELESIFP